MYMHTLHTIPVQLLTFISIEMSSGLFYTLQNKAKACPIVDLPPLWPVLMLFTFGVLFLHKKPNLME